MRNSISKSNDHIRVLLLGDVVGNPGREVCKQAIPRLREDDKVDFVIANVENLAGGSGITESTIKDLFSAGVDVMTSGDHIFRKKEAEEILAKDHRILRPANYPSNNPGVGSALVKISEGLKIGVVNLIGRVFLKSVDCPFAAAKKEIEKLREETALIFVDIHAEATSEKKALGWFLDGEVSAVVGTHTHVQTADDQILPRGTAYVTDLGMCGSHHSVIGREIEDALKLFVTQMPVKLRVATEENYISGLLIDVDKDSGRAVNVQRVFEKGVLEFV